MAPRRGRARDDSGVTRSRIGAVVVIVAAGVVVGGCGGGSGGSGSSSTTASATSPPAAAQPIPPAAPPSAERVIRRWAATLRRGDVAGASALFALPSIVQVDPAGSQVRLTRRAEVLAFNASLPCGATIIRTERRGAYAEVLFRLVQRVGALCDGPGHTARAAFRVRDGLIVEWRRRVDDPDDPLAKPRPPKRKGGGGTGGGDGTPAI